MTNKYNLIDEPCIPVQQKGYISLKEVFSKCDIPIALLGNPLEKIALLKFLLSIAQAAVSLETQQDWDSLTDEDFAQQVMIYLEKWRDRFYLYGEQPFLQMPAIYKARMQSYGALMPNVASKGRGKDTNTENAVVLWNSQLEKPLNDAQKFNLLLIQMCCSFGGKKTDNSVVLSASYRGKFNDKGKPATSKPGPAIGFKGLLHTFIWGENLLQTIRFNLLTKEDVDQSNLYENGIGRPVWEKMPENENCPTAQMLQSTLQGRLVGLNRFCLLAEQGIHYSEGIQYASYLDGFVDPSVMLDKSKAKLRVFWADPNKRPWRELPAMLSFRQQGMGHYHCLILSRFLRSHKMHDLPVFGIWSGGLSLSQNAGEQYVSGTNDYVESLLWIYPEHSGTQFINRLKHEIDKLQKKAEQLYASTKAYYKKLNMDNPSLSDQASQLFWQLVERDKQGLIDACESEENINREALSKKHIAILLQIYDQYCPNFTAKQMEAWCKTRPYTYFE